MISANQLVQKSPSSKSKIGAIVWNNDVGWVNGAGVERLYGWTRPIDSVSWKIAMATLFEHVGVVIKLNLMDLVDWILVELDGFQLGVLVPSQILSNIDSVRSKRSVCIYLGWLLNGPEKGQA